MVYVKAAHSRLDISAANTLAEKRKEEGRETDCFSKKRSKRRGGKT